MAQGIKKIETRHWPVPKSCYGPLLIHAAKRKPRKYELDHIVISLINHGYANRFSLSGLPRGAIVCRLNLVSCERMTESNIIKLGGIEPLEYSLGNYEEGRFMWITENVEKFKEPVPWKGSQGFFNVPGEIANKKIHEDSQAHL